MKAFLSADRKTVLLAGRQYRGSFPVENIDAQIRMYADLAARDGGKFERVYSPTVFALQRVRDRLNERDAA